MVRYSFPYGIPLPQTWMESRRFPLHPPPLPAQPQLVFFPRKRILPNYFDNVTLRLKPKSKPQRARGTRRRPWFLAFCSPHLHCNKRSAAQVLCPFVDFVVKVLKCDIVKLQTQLFPMRAQPLSAIFVFRHDLLHFPPKPAGMVLHPQMT